MSLGIRVVATPSPLSVGLGLTHTVLKQLHCMHAVEGGLPVLGMALGIAKPCYTWQDIFEKHNTDALRLYLGPGTGWVVAVHTLDDMHECIVTKGHTMYLQMPGIVSPNGRAIYCVPLAAAATLDEGA